MSIYLEPDRLRELMERSEPVLDPAPFAEAWGCHVEDLVPLYRRDRDRLIGEFYD